MNMNYQHLYYFWVVAKASSLTAAAQRLGLSPSTVSTQIKTLEEKIENPTWYFSNLKAITINKVHVKISMMM